MVSTFNASTIRAVFSDGVFRPLDTVDLENGSEVTLTYGPPKKEVTLEEKLAILDRTTGAWKDTVDCEKLKRDIYESRGRGSRPEPKL